MRTARAVRFHIAMAALFFCGPACLWVESADDPSDPPATSSDVVRVDIVDVFALSMGGRTEHVVYLLDPRGERYLQVWIGPCEAGAIHRKLHEEPFPRPLTHDLLARIIERSGMRMEAVVIDELRPLEESRSSGTFFAAITLALGDGREIRVDARPSDAMATAVRTGTPVYVARSILDGHGIPSGEAPPGLHRREAQEPGDEPPDGGFY